MIAEILKSMGEDVVLGGNYGIPVSEVVLKHADADWLILEGKLLSIRDSSKFFADGWNSFKCTAESLRIDIIR